jgi:DHA1 family tetracycline resistance protein-like MFS transporter
MSASSTLPPRRAAVAFVLVTIALDVIAIGIVIPVLPKLIESMSGGNTARAAEVFGLFSSSWALMQFFFSPLLGMLSDRFGRRPVILLSNLGLGLDYVLMAVAPSLAWLFLGRILSGICAASFSTASAYIADVTPPEKRAAAFGTIGAAFGLGFVLGPALGGLLGELDPRLPFWVAAGFSLANAAYGYFILPESLPPERRDGFSLAKANPVGALRLLASHPGLLGLAGVVFLFQLAHTVLPAVTVLYAGHRYGWGPREIGLLLALVGICAAVVQGGLTRPIVAHFGERVALLAGIAFGTIGFAVYGLAPSGLLFLLGVLPQSLWGLSSAATQSLMSQRVSASEQGQLQGAGSSMMAIANMGGPILFAFVFSAAIAPGRATALAGAPYLLAAAMLVGAGVLARRVTRGRRGVADQR